MIRAAHQPTEISIAKEVMSAKREMKILSTKKHTAVEMGPMDVDDFQNFYGKFRIGKFKADYNGTYLSKLRRIKIDCKMEPYEI